MVDFTCNSNKNNEWHVRIKQSTRRDASQRVTQNTCRDEPSLARRAGYFSSYLET
jgi:hypothetical protein